MHLLTWKDVADPGYPETTRLYELAVTIKSWLRALRPSSIEGISLHHFCVTGHSFLGPPQDRQATLLDSSWVALVAWVMPETRQPGHSLALAQRQEALPPSVFFASHGQ